MASNQIRPLRDDLSQRRPRLQGKVAIVTGAGSSGPGTGTGKAISVLFAREGARVLLVDRIAKHAEAADINVIDLPNLAPELPELVHDLPGGAKRLVQRAREIRATIVNGEVLHDGGRYTGAT